MPRFSLADINPKFLPEIERQLARNPKSDSERPDTLVERDLRDGALAKGEAEERDSRKFLIRVTSFRRRLLDEDNLCEKYHVDCCRYAGLVSGDAPGTTKIEVGQEKVRSKEEERTLITITQL